MNKKYLLTSILSLTMAFLMLSTFTTVNCAQAPWEIGDMFSYLYKYYQENHLIDYKENTEYKVTYGTNEIALINITDIDNNTRTYEYDVFTGVGSSNEMFSYDYELFLDELKLSSCMTVTYEWNYESNTTVMTNFDFGLPLWRFLYPNWTAINTQFVNSFNSSEVIFVLSNPYEPILYNFTLGDVLTSATSYSIMGKNNLAEGKQQFTSATTKWVFEFDFSNVIKVGIFNNTLGYNNYYETEIYKIKMELEYSSIGVLEFILYSMESKITFDDQMNYFYMKAFQDLDGTLDPTTKTSNFAYLIVLPAIWSLCILPKIIKYKKN